MSARMPASCPFMTAIERCLSKKSRAAAKYSSRRAQSSRYARTASAIALASPGGTNFTAMESFASVG